jgi:hypothetical protein
VARIAVPARRGRGDIALGNITGSIVHFVALNAGVIAIVKPIELDTDTLHLHLPVAVAATAVFCAVLGLRHRLGPGRRCLPMGAVRALHRGGRGGWPLTRAAAPPSIQYADLYPEREESYEVDQA